MDTVRVLLVGLGGYGNKYVDAVLDHAEEMRIELVGAVDPDPVGCRRHAELVTIVGTIHPTLEAFYAHGSADLAVISAPIHLHASFTTTALQYGSHVLCEKPVASVVQDAVAMTFAEEGSPGTVAIGYQWSFSDTVQQIRRDVASGRFGVPLQLKTVVFWPRSRSYFNRTSWAGRLKAPDGTWILDSPANNATAHYLHNSFFVLGLDGGRPLSVEAELYQANEIESFDTAALRVETASGAEVLFYTAHAVPSNVGPVVHYRFSEADLYCEVPGNFFARFADGSVEDLGSPEVAPADKLRRASADVRNGNPPACTIDDATHQSVAVCGAHESGTIVGFPPNLIRRTVTAEHADGPADELVWVDGLQAAFTQCFAHAMLPSEHGGIEWARRGRIVGLSEYERFPTNVPGEPLGPHA